MNPQQYCQDKASRSGSSFYYSFLFLPPNQREAITALYAFCREVDDVVDDCSNQEIARKKLDWWKEEVHRLFTNCAQHPVGKALQPAKDQFNLPQEYFLEIIDGMEMDLEISRYHTFNELALYCHRAAGVVGVLSAEIFGYKDHHTLDYAHNLGVAFQLTNILRDIREDALRGRIYIPFDELQQYAVTPEELSLGVTSDRCKKLFAHQAKRARQYYETAFTKLPDIDRFSQRSGIIMAKIYRTLLEEIEQDDYRVLEHRIKLTPLRKLWMAWKTMRHEKKLARKATDPM